MKEIQYSIKRRIFKENYKYKSLKINNLNGFTESTFKIKVGDIRNSLPKERQAILERIKTGSQNGQCSCKTRNPKGSCCIGDAKKLIDKFNQ